MIYESEPPESLKWPKTSLSAKMSYQVNKSESQLSPVESKKKVESVEMKLLILIFLKFSQGKFINNFIVIEWPRSKLRTGL